MGVVTRSTRLTTCEKVKSPMAPNKPVQFLLGNKGFISRLTFRHPASKAVFFSLQLPLPMDSTMRASVEKSYQYRAPMAVVAYDNENECGYECGTYTVTHRNKTTFTLQKHMSAVVKEAREAAMKQVQTQVQQRVAKLERQKKVQQETVPVVFLPAPEPESVPVPETVPVPLPETGLVPEPVAQVQEQVQNPTVTTVHARPAHAAVAQPAITSFFGRPNMPKAIPTTYNGTNYRSRLESKFARMLDALHIRFVYEPMRVRTADRGSYMIDFFLPDQQLYVELKPKRPHVEEERKCEDMSKMGFRVVLMYGEKFYKLPYRSEFFNGRSHRDYDHHDAVRGMCWISGKKLPGDTVFVIGTNPQLQTPLDVTSPTQIHLNQVQSTYDMRWSHESIKDALRPLKFM